MTPVNDNKNKTKDDNDDDDNDDEEEEKLHRRSPSPAACQVEPSTPLQLFSVWDRTSLGSIAGGSLELDSPLVSLANLCSSFAAEDGSLTCNSSNSSSVVGRMERFSDSSSQTQRQQMCFGARSNLSSSYSSKEMIAENQDDEAASLLIGLSTPLRHAAAAAEEEDDDQMLDRLKTLSSRPDRPVTGASPRISTCDFLTECIPPSARRFLSPLLPRGLPFVPVPINFKAQFDCLHSVKLKSSARALQMGRGRDSSSEPWGVGSDEQEYGGEEAESDGEGGDRSRSEELDVLGQKRSWVKQSSSVTSLGGGDGRSGGDGGGQTDHVLTRAGSQHKHDLYAGRQCQRKGRNATFASPGWGWRRRAIRSPHLVNVKDLVSEYKDDVNHHTTDEHHYDTTGMYNMDAYNVDSTTIHNNWRGSTIGDNKKDSDDGVEAYTHIRCVLHDSDKSVSRLVAVQPGQSKVGLMLQVALPATSPPSSAGGGDTCGFDDSDDNTQLETSHILGSDENLYLNVTVSIGQKGCSHAGLINRCNTATATKGSRLSIGSLGGKNENVAGSGINRRGFCSGHQGVAQEHHLVGYGGRCKQARDDGRDCNIGDLWADEEEEVGGQEDALSASVRAAGRTKKGRKVKATTTNTTATSSSNSTRSSGGIGAAKVKNEQLSLLKGMALTTGAAAAGGDDEKKKKKRKRDKGKHDPATSRHSPIKPRNAYAIFCLHESHNIAAANPLDGTDLSKRIARRWRGMSEAEKQRYFNLSKEDKERYCQELQAQMEWDSTHGGGDNKNDDTMDTH